MTLSSPICFAVASTVHFHAVPTLTTTTGKVAVTLLLKAMFVSMLEVGELNMNTVLSQNALLAVN